MNILESILEFSNQTANILGLLTTVISLLTWVFLNHKMKQQHYFDNQLLNFYLNVEKDQCYHFPIRIRRKDLTRAEIFGILGMIPMKQEKARFDLRYFFNPEFFHALEEAQKGNSAMTVKVSASEAVQFDLIALAEMCKR